ncbi:M48 family metallopeptidase [Streptomyces huiliensis]|uniref:M48 family metallopeptidase n=1 Tax=Streptomyces huiliensis TaxID=2876027 RepID=UPI001CBE235B|nr:M48 family metallopeptidase [Streptomyces huiliensis]MBZ4320466.1 M48 family metallopeptidase [Streptomyces huiliensis]
MRARECGGTVPVDERYVDWCDACDWNVDSARTEPPPGRITAVRRALARRYGEQLADEMGRRDGLAPPKRDAPTVAAFALALLVHGVTAAVAVAGVLLVVLGWSTVVQPLLGVVLLAVAVVVFPRPARLPGNTPVLYRADAPRLFGLIDEVGGRVGTAGVHAVLVTAEFNASVTVYGFRRRRVLTLGLPLWRVLSPQERVALLGHELGHFAHGDIRYGAVTGEALRTLSVWHYTLAPGPVNGPVDLFVNGMTFLPRRAVQGLLLLLDHLSLRASQRAEYLADADAARAGSTEAAVGLMDRLLLVGTVHSELRRVAAAASMRGGRGGHEARQEAERGLWDGLAGHVGAVPEREVERLRRAGARRGHSVDSTHPPTHLRRRCLLAGGPSPAGIVYGDALSAATAAELAPAEAELARRVVRDRVR